MTVGRVADAVKLFCFLPPYSAVTSLSSAAESLTSTPTPAQAAAHPPPRPITRQSGSRWEETQLQSLFYPLELTLTLANASHLSDAHKCQFSAFQPHPGVFVGVLLPDVPRHRRRFGSEAVEDAQ